jgi:hypothetical protein
VRGFASGIPQNLLHAAQPEDAIAPDLQTDARTGFANRNSLSIILASDHLPLRLLPHPSHHIPAWPSSPP